MIRKSLRLLLVAGIVAGSSIWALPAGANHWVVQTEPCPAPEPETSPDPSPSPSPTPTPAPEGCVPPEGSSIRGTLDLTFRVMPWSPLGQLQPQRVAVWVVPTEEGLDAETKAVRAWHGDEAPDDGVFTFAWDSVVQTPLNGEYMLRVDIEGPGDHFQSEELGKGLIVDNDPARPGAPVVSETTTSAITVTWDRAPEPDVTGYIVFRAETEGEEPPPESDLQALDVAESESYIDDSTEQGKTYWYALRVLRRSLVFPNGRWSELGPMSGGGALAPPPSEQITPPTRARPGVQRARPPAPRSRPGVPDPGFDRELQYDRDRAVRPPMEASEGSEDPRGAVLPVAVGAFLVSAALAFGRMPY